MHAASPPQPPLRALIFDFDGLMVDTETAIYRSWGEIYAAHGQELPLATYVQCVGSHGHSYDPLHALEALTGKALDRAGLQAQQSGRNRELHAGLGPLPGIRELLLEAAELGVRCAVASSSDAAWVLGWLEKLALRQHFSAVITRDDVARVKPAPDLFLLALARLEVGGAEALVLEDSANGLHAAHAAGVRCVIVPNEVTRGLDFAKAAAVLPTLANITLAMLQEITPPPPQSRR